jgi:RNA polymerase sigma-70 factor, ECF subfamily
MLRVGAGRAQRRSGREPGHCACGLVEELDRSGALSGYYLLPATRADLLRRLGRGGEAQAAYRRALQLAPTEPERRYLARKLAEISAGG